MTVRELIVDQAEKVHQQLKENLQSVKRVALNETWKSLQLVTASTVQIIETVAKDLEGKAKKDIAIEYINNFYDKAFLVVDIPFVPSLVEPIIHKYIKKILMIMVSASIDATVTIFRETGIFLKKGTV
jgi:FMN-dependent NADH-azoreductase